MTELLYLGGCMLLLSVLFAVGVLAFADGKSERGLSCLSFLFSAVPFACSLAPFFLILLSVACVPYGMLSLILLALAAYLALVCATVGLPCGALGVLYAVRRQRRTGEGKGQIVRAAVSLGIGLLFLALLLAFVLPYA